MFINDFNKFKKDVEKTIDSFFNLTPEEAVIVEHNLWLNNINRYDFDKVEFKSVPADVKEDLLKYKTLKYFNSVYSKLTELQQILKEGNDDGITIFNNQSKD